MAVVVEKTRRVGFGRRPPQYPHLLADLLTRVLHRRQYLFLFAVLSRPARPSRAANRVRAFTLTVLAPFAGGCTSRCRTSQAGRPPSFARATSACRTSKAGLMASACRR